MKLLLAAIIVLAASNPQKPAPTLVLDTARGSIEIQLFTADAPVTVARIVELVQKGFYRGLRFHRVESTLIQAGDPLTRDVSRKDYWGGGGSGKPIGVAEISKKRTHQRGTVGMASAGEPRFADSQFYIMKVASPSLNGRYAIIGQVTKGMDVVDKIQAADVIKLATVK